MGELNLVGCIGFAGNVVHGVVTHPDREHIIYPLGCNIVVQKIAGKRAQSFLQGHTDFVTCIAVSQSGRYVASGQQTHQGFEADIIIWDFQSRQELRRFKLHKVKVQALAFSPSDMFLASLGGVDDGQLAMWDVDNGKALCSARTRDGRGGQALTVAFCNHNDSTWWG
eukprot:m.240212 g.240212  ORF g.240212 m.240212 type:complete len:168 (+) comp16075_c0_seq3:369-872(+)